MGDLHRNAPAAARIALRRRLADRPRQFMVARLDRAPGDIDRRPLLGERQRHPLADAPARAGDDRDLAVQRFHDPLP